MPKGVSAAQKKELMVAMFQESLDVLTEKEVEKRAPKKAKAKAAAAPKRAPPEAKAKVPQPPSFPSRLRRHNGAPSARHNECKG